MFYWNVYIGNTRFLGQIRSKKILPLLSSRMEAFALLGETWPMEIFCLRVTDMTLKEALSVNIYTRSNSSKWIWTPSNPIWYREELQMHSNILLLCKKIWCNYLQNWQLISLNINNSCESLSFESELFFSKGSYISCLAMHGELGGNDFLYSKWDGTVRLRQQKKF